MNISNETQIFLDCEHCGNRAIHTLLASEPETELIEFEPNQIFEEDFEISFVRCETYKKHALFSFINGLSEEATFLYSRERQIDSMVPEPIRNSYLEALKVKRHSATAFVIMVRRALELLCKQENAQGRNLLKMIDDLDQKGIIPKALSEMANLIRLLGNQGAHNTSKIITRKEIDALDYFYSAIVEYVYIAPNKISQLKNNLNLS